MNCRVIVTLITLAAGLAAQAAHGTPLSPTDDGFGYQFAVLANSPLSTGDPFFKFLPVGATTSGHDIKSSLKFDLTGLTLAQATSSTLDLWVGDTTATGFGINPSPANPISVSLYALGAGAWTEATLTWNNTPVVVGAAYDTLSISGVNQIASFDVTELVKDWIDGTVANNGLVLIADAPVGASPNWVYAVFDSSEFGVSPELNVVPEPGTVALALCAVPALFWYGRRRSRNGR